MAYVGEICTAHISTTARAWATEAHSQACSAPPHTMQRLAISIDDELAQQFDTWADNHGYANRSEAFRDLVRKELSEAHVQQQPDAPCVGTLSFLYDHHERTLSLRLMELQHDHHELTVSAMHAHLDHDLCMETVILRGPAAQVRTFALRVLAERGVRQGHLHLVPLAQA